MCSHFSRFSRSSGNPAMYPVANIFILVSLSASTYLSFYIALLEIETLFYVCSRVKFDIYVKAQANKQKWYLLVDFITLFILKSALNLHPKLSLIGSFSVLSTNPTSCRPRSS